MVVVDTSVIVAILLAEPDADVFARVLIQRRCVISTLNVFEAETVIRRRIGPGAPTLVRKLLAERSVALTPFDDVQSQAASRAYEVFGKGRHPARLNLCDCAAYALAKSLEAPLLYKGEDFARTDITPALA